MVEQMPKNDSNDLEDKVRTLQEQNAKLIQILRSQGCLVDSLIQPENATNVIQPLNVVPLDSFPPPFLNAPSTVDPHPLPLRAKTTSIDETMNLLDNESNHKHPRPIRPKPSFQLFNSLTLNETTKPLLNNVLTPSALINNTNASTCAEEISSSPQLSQPKKFGKARTRIRKTTPIPIAPNLGRPLAPAPLNVQRIVTTTKRSSSQNGAKKRPAKATDRFAESISGLMKHFDQELLASNFLPPATTTNILSRPATTTTQDDFPVPLINEEEMRLVEMNFDETTFLKQFELDTSSEENLYPSLLNARRNSSPTSYSGASLIKNNVFTTLVPLEASRTRVRASLPEEGVQLTARHIEPSQVATYEAPKFPDILDELVTVSDQDVLTHAQVSVTSTDFPLNFLEETPTDDVDLEYFYPIEEKSETSSPKSEITDLSSIIQIGQSRTSPVVHRIVFEPILSPPPTTSNAEQYPTEEKTREEKRRKSSSNVDRAESQTPLNNQIPPTPGEYDETFCPRVHSNDEPISKTTFITPPPDNEHHEQKSSSSSSSSDEQHFQQLKKTKTEHFDSATTKSPYLMPPPPVAPTQPDPYAQTYHQYHPTTGSTPFFHYSFGAHPYMNSPHPPAAPPPPSHYYPNYHQTPYNYPPPPPPQPNYMSSYDHQSYKR